MDLENLTQYDAGQFFRMLGHLFQQRRQELNLSLAEVSASTGLKPEKLEGIEKGLLSLSEEEIHVLSGLLNVPETEMLKLAKITQVNVIMDLTRELNANFPE